MSKLNIVFAGTPTFTMPSLEALFASKHTLKAIYTQPDRPAGRGKILQASAVKEWAQTHNLPIYQPSHFKEQQTIETLRSLEPDILVVIAYGIILPRAVLDIPRLGCINVHASLLPRWRGASPIQHSILFGDKQTGITIMQLNPEMDAGDILKQVACPIFDNDTTSTLHDRLSELAPDPLLQTLDDLSHGLAHPLKQDQHQVTYAPKIDKKDALINWQRKATDIAQQIRAYHPWPVAYTSAASQIVRVHKATVINLPFDAPSGTILSINKSGLIVATGVGALMIEQIQFPGAKTISINDYLNANHNTLKVGDILGEV